MRTVRALCLISLAIVCLLTGAQPGAAKICDEVLYVAKDLTGLRHVWGGRRLLEPLRVPYYVGAVCVDNVNKELEYFSQTEDGFLNFWMHGVVRRMNGKKNPTVSLSADLEYLKLGEGEPNPEPWCESFAAPTNTALYPYWTEQALRGGGFEVIRREVNAEPDLKWTPKIERTFYYADLEPEPEQEVYDWTEKTCDEVLYIALDGTRFFYWDFYSDEINIPHYLGAVCVDTVDKRLIFAPRNVNSSVSKIAGFVVDDINNKRRPIMMVLSNPRNRELGEGTAWGECLAVPKDTALFPYWAGEDLHLHGIKAFRREVNAKLDPDWTPEFTQALPFYEHYTAPSLSYR